MNMENKSEILYIAEACESVHTALGGGFSERVYHNALEVYFRLNQITYDSELVVPVAYQGHQVGSVRIDLMVDGKVVVECKAIAGKLRAVDREQLMKYIRLCPYVKAGVLVNFGTELSYVFIHRNER